MPDIGYRSLAVAPVVAPIVAPAVAKVKETCFFIYLRQCWLGLLPPQPDSRNPTVLIKPFAH